MEDEELVKMFNPTLKRKVAILFFLIVVINGLKCIVSDIGLNTCARGMWRVEVSKFEMNQPLGSSYLTAHSEKYIRIESECRASVQIVLCNSFLYTNCGGQLSPTFKLYWRRPDPISSLIPITLRGEVEHACEELDRVWGRWSPRNFCPRYLVNLLIT